jgi:hypothetical protein
VIKGETEGSESEEERQRDRYRTGTMRDRRHETGEEEGGKTYEKTEGRDTVEIQKAERNRENE